MAPSTINGNVFEDAAATVTGPGTINGSTTIQSMLALDTDATTASSDAAALVANQTFSSITSATTITGNGGTTVVGVTGNINMNNANLILSGGANDYFVINIGGNLALVGTASLNVVGTPLAT